MPHLSIEKIIDIKKQRRTQKCAVPIYWNPFGLVLVPAAEKPPLKLQCSFACYRTKREKHHELVEAELLLLLNLTKQVLLHIVVLLHHHICQSFHLVCFHYTQFPLFVK